MSAIDDYHQQTMFSNSDSSMSMDDPGIIRQRLANLTAQLDQVRRAWTVDDYEAFVRFYVSIVPKILDADRCSIFLRQHEGDTAWLKLGTNLQERQIEAPVEGSFVGKVISTGHVIIESNLESRPGFHTTVTSTTGFSPKTLPVPPLRVFQGEASSAPSKC